VGPIPCATSRGLRTRWGLRRKTGSILAPPIERPVRIVRSTASNLDTLLDRGFDRRVRMLLSFQRPSHPSGRSSSSNGAPDSNWRRGGPTSIAPGPGVNQKI
jgi:hypothetical protein